MGFNNKSKIEYSLLKAKDLMTKNLITLTKKNKVHEAIILLTKHKISGAPVIDYWGRIQGMFTESDILRFFSAHPGQKMNLLNVPIVFSEKVISVKEETPLFQIQKLLLENGFRAVPVIDHDSKVVGIISRRDLLKYIFLVNKQKGEEAR